jgi:hypothetical protein
VIVPTYQGARYLGDALESIARNALQDTEVLVVDDGSTDGTVEVARAFESTLRLHTLVTPRRGNWMAMVNLGLAEATGASCCILHQDDLWLPGRRRVPLTDIASGRASMVCMQTAVIDAAGHALGPWRFPRGVRPCMGRAVREEVARSLYVQNWLAVPSVTFGTRAAGECGGLDESLWYTADWDLWLQLLHTGSAILMPQFGTAFRVHSSSQTLQRSRNIEEFHAQLATVQRRHRWALDGQLAAPGLRRAGELSTRTDAALAAGFHRQPHGYLRWLGSILAAGPRGIRVYLDNASLGDRLRPRVRLAVQGALSGSSDTVPLSRARPDGGVRWASRPEDTRRLGSRD